MTYRVSVFKYLDIPKAISHATVEGGEQDAIAQAKGALTASDGDLVVVALIEGGETKVIHRFEKVKKAS